MEKKRGLRRKSASLKPMCYLKPRNHCRQDRKEGCTECTEERFPAFGVRKTWGLVLVLLGPPVKVSLPSCNLVGKD